MCCCFSAPRALANSHCDWQRRESPATYESISCLGSQHSKAGSSRLRAGIQWLSHRESQTMRESTRPGIDTAGRAGGVRATECQIQSPRLEFCECIGDIKPPSKPSDLRKDRREMIVDAPPNFREKEDDSGRTDSTAAPIRPHFPARIQ
jgi:hypothetical protein